MTAMPFRSILVLAAVLAAAPAAAQVYPERIPSAGARRAATARARAAIATRAARSEQTERTTKTVRIGATGELDVANISGDILISRGSGADATIEIVKSARGAVGRRCAGDAGAGAGRRRPSAAAAPKSARATRTATRCAAQQPPQRQRLGHPHDHRAGRRARHGALDLRQRQRPRHARRAHARIDQRQRARSPTAAASRRPSRSPATSRSPAPRSTARSTRRASAATVAVRKTKARQLSLQTVSGNLCARGCRLRAGRAAGGQRRRGRFSARWRRAAATTLNSHSGDVTVTLDGDTGFELDANSFSGSIRSDLPLTGGSRRRPRPPPARRPRRLRQRQRRPRPHHLLGIVVIAKR